MRARVLTAVACISDELPTLVFSLSLSLSPSLPPSLPPLTAVGGVAHLFAIARVDELLRLHEQRLEVGDAGKAVLHAPAQNDHCQFITYPQGGECCTFNGSRPTLYFFLFTTFPGQNTTQSASQIKGKMVWFLQHKLHSATSCYFSGYETHICCPKVTSKAGVHLVRRFLFIRFSTKVYPEGCRCVLY